jgi:hypothetical protein
MGLGPEPSQVDVPFASVPRSRMAYLQQLQRPICRLANVPENRLDRRVLGERIRA